MTKEEKKRLATVLRATEYLFLENIALKLVLEHRAVPNWQKLLERLLADVRSVQQFAGHKTIQMTMRYAHLAPSHLAAAVEKLCQPTAIATAIPTASDAATREAKKPAVQ